MPVIPNYYGFLKTAFYYIPKSMPDIPFPLPKLPLGARNTQQKHGSCAIPERANAAHRSIGGL
jgi:hypothetical protein